MILFLIEIYLLGCAISIQFREEISDFFLSFLAILLGFFAYFINVIVLTVIQVPVSVPLLSILMGVDITLILFTKWLVSRRIISRFQWSLFWYFGAGVFLILGSIFFLNEGYVFATPDSLYLVTMGEDILETGLSTWHFASPTQWGMFVPSLQLIGLLFDYEYSWFIQPIMSLTFLVVFGFAVFKSSRSITSKKIVPYIVTLFSIGLMISSKIYGVAQFYIHTNLDTGISFFLIVVSLYFAIRDNKNSWLGIAAIFLILFGMTRSENVILASLVIVLTVASRKISHRKLLWMFLPYLIFQISWNWIIIRVNPQTFTNIITISQLRLVTIGLVALVIFIILSGQAWLQDKILPWLTTALVIGISILLLGVFLLEPERIFFNTWNNLQTMFVSGKWQLTFWGVVILLLLVKTENRNILNNYFNLLIFAFFSMIIFLGYLKGSYHSLWYDSANRMYIHILPILVFYLSNKISSNFPLEDQPLD